jgi:IS5 family transposase
MKEHISVDVESGLVRAVTTTPTNVSDVTEVDKPLHSQEQTVHGDAGYQGAQKRARKRGCTWFIAAKHESVKAMARTN